MSLNQTPTTIVCGPPGAGKSTYVAERMAKGDLVLDVDALFSALSLLGSREKPDGLLMFVLAARDAVISTLASGIKGPAHAWIVMCGEHGDSRTALAQRLGASVVVLPVPTGECIRRMRAQGRPAWHVREMGEVCIRWHRFFRLLPGEEIAVHGREIGVDGWPVDDPVA